MDQGLGLSTFAQDPQFDVLCQERGKERQELFEAKSLKYGCTYFAERVLVGKGPPTAAPTGMD